MGCHFLLQCRKVKREGEVAQLCPTLRDPMDCSPPGSSVHGIFQARGLEWGAIAFSKLKRWSKIAPNHKGKALQSPNPSLWFKCLAQSPSPCNFQLTVQLTNSGWALTAYSRLSAGIWLHFMIRSKSTRNRCCFPLHRFTERGPLLPSVVRGEAWRSESAEGRRLLSVLLLFSPSVVSDSFWPHGCSPPGSPVHGILLSKNAEVGSHFLLQRIFPTQGSNTHLLHCPIPCHQGSPVLEVSVGVA